MRSGRPGCGVRPHRPSHRIGHRTAAARARIVSRVISICNMTGIWVRFIHEGEWQWAGQWVFTLQFLKINIYQTASLQTKAVHSTDYSHGLPRAGPLGPGPRLLPDALLHACTASAHHANGSRHPTRRGMREQCVPLNATRHHSPHKRTDARGHGTYQSTTMWKSMSHGQSP